MWSCNAHRKSAEISLTIDSDSAALGWGQDSALLTSSWWCRWFWPLSYYLCPIRISETNISAWVMIYNTTGHDVIMDSDPETQKIRPTNALACCLQKVSKRGAGKGNLRAAQWTFWVEEKELRTQGRLMRLDVEERSAGNERSAQRKLQGPAEDPLWGSSRDWPAHAYEETTHGHGEPGIFPPARQEYFMYAPWLFRKVLPRKCSIINPIQHCSGPAYQILRARLKK